MRNILIVLVVMTCCGSNVAKAETICRTVCEKTYYGQVVCRTICEDR